MIVVFGAIMYFLLIRPQQKRMKEHESLVSSLEPGSRVLLASGMIATIVHTGERQFIVELAPGVEVTVLKGAVQRVVAADEEEFEFEDDVEPEAQPEPGVAFGAGDLSQDGAYDQTPSDYVSPDEAYGTEDYVASDEELKAMFEGPDADDPTTKPDDDNPNR